MKWKIASLFGAVFLFFGLIAAGQASAAVIWQDDMESGAGGWQADGFWHLQANPQHQHIAADLYNYTALYPDMGYLPYANSGQHAWWYGQSRTGTYLGWPYPAQDPLSGGAGTAANSGSLTTPQIDLTGTDTATLSFWTWWEVESVDPNWFDLMQVSVSPDGTNWTELGYVNPTYEVFAGSWMPYSSGGVGQIGNWVKPKYDLTPWAGKKVYLRFTFDTDDILYNGFRGWLVDDVKVTDRKILPSFKGARAYALRKCEGDQMVTDPDIFRVTKAQWVDVDFSQKYAITKHGKYVRVCSNTKKCYLPKGTYTLWSYNHKKNNACPGGEPSSATVRFNRAGVWPPARNTDDPLALEFFGKNFTGDMRASFNNGTSEEIMILSANQGQILDPSLPEAAALADRGGQPDAKMAWSDVNEARAEQGERTMATLPPGNYDLVISSAEGAGEKTMKGAYTVTANDPPFIFDGAPASINNDDDITFTLIGENISQDTKILIGGMPLQNVSYDEAAGEYTGSVKKGMSPGYQTVIVKNPDGVVTTYPNIIEVRPVTDELFDGTAGKNVSRPKKVRKIRVSHLDSGNIRIAWEKKKRAKYYRYRVKYEGKVIKRGKIKHPKHSKVLDEYFIAEHRGKTVKVSVKAFNKYKGKWSKPKAFLVE